MHTNCSVLACRLHAAQEASWERVFDPVYPILFDLYHQLRTNVHWYFHPLSEPGLISASCQWTGLTPAGFQEAFRAVRGG